MDHQSAPAAEPFRFSLRSLFFVITCLCLVAGFFWFVSLVLLLLFAALIAQCLFFLAVQRLVNRFPGALPPDE